MKLSTTARYGLRAMSDLCIHSGSNQPVRVNDIASRQNIPVNYLEQLFGKLRRSGLLSSVRGAQGGYKLARSASDITIADILEALDEPFIWVMPDRKGLRERCNLSYVQVMAEGQRLSR
ncbi:MAG: Rrf2 family transcriptional regulator [Synergistaceae bacterium]|nr:Rrf2 family transcriptional regulator [Synergistaceae bacterium]